MMGQRLDIGELLCRNGNSFDVRSTPHAVWRRTAAVYRQEHEPEMARVVANFGNFSAETGVKYGRSVQTPVWRTRYAQMDDAVDAAGPGRAGVPVPLGTRAAGPALGRGKREPRSGEVSGVER